MTAAFGAVAEVGTGTWTKTTWSKFTAASNNIVRPNYLASGSTYTDFTFCDGCSATIQYGNGKTVTWEFPRVATEISGFNIYSYWSDTGRDDIRIASIAVKHSADGAWETLAGSSVQHNHTGTMQKALLAKFAETNGLNLAENVTAVRITLASQENGGAGYVEMEVLGTLTPGSDPESDYVWTTGGYNPSTWQALGDSNMMAYCSSILKNGTATTSYDATTDGSVAQYSIFIASGTTMTWLYAQAFDLYAFSIFSRWGDAGRDSVSVWKFETLDEDGVWTRRTGPEEYGMVGTGQNIDKSSTSAGHNFATLRRKDGGAIATGVKGVRVFTYYGDEACWAEAEAEGCMAAGPAIFDERSVTVANDCWKVDWTAKVASFGASDSATVNLWTSTDNVNFTLADTVVATETDKAYAFTKTFDDVNLTIYYRFETLNASGSKSWATTNTVASVVNHDNATYYWKDAVCAGLWESANSWSNSHNDARLTWPTDKYTTANFSRLGTSPVTVGVTASHTPRITWPAAGATLVFTAKSTAVSLAFSAQTAAISGTNVFRRIRFSPPSGAYFADYARVILCDGAVCSASEPQLRGGKYGGVELYGGSSFSASGYIQCGNGGEFVLDGGSVTDAGYFPWSGSGGGPSGRIVFRPGGGTFRVPGGHNTLYSNTTPFEFRYEVPGEAWSGYSAAPLQPGRVNTQHQFGNGPFKANVTYHDARQKPYRAANWKLIEMCDSSTIKTNGFSFAAFGEALKVGVRNDFGDYFYWTFDRSESREPSVSGALPTGLRFHFAGRHPGLRAVVR